MNLKLYVLLIFIFGVNNIFAQVKQVVTNNIAVGYAFCKWNNDQRETLPERMVVIGITSGFKNEKKKDVINIALAIKNGVFDGEKIDLLQLVLTSGVKYQDYFDKKKRFFWNAGFQGGFVTLLGTGAGAVPVGFVISPSVTVGTAITKKVAVEIGYTQYYLQEFKGGLSFSASYNY